ncbi:MAG: exosortase H-associated membrane protein [Thiolinea sp.]
MTARPLHRFMLGVLIFFPLTFFVWYLSATFHLAPVVLISESIIHLVVPDALMWLRLDNYTLVVASNFGPDAAGNIVSPPQSEDLLGFHLNPLIYCYSLPLLMSLILATPGEDKWLNLIWGMLLVMPTEIFSMVFSVLKVLTFDVGAAFQAQQALTPLGADLIAFAYQMGTLVLPMIAPLIIWMVLNRRFIVELAPQLERVFAH